MQILEERSKLKKSKNEPGGYCSVWSMFFTELCLKNPEISSSEIMDNIYNYLTTKPIAEDYLKKVIRGYAGYIVENVNKYLEIFFKPKLTIIDILNFSKKGNFRKLAVLNTAINVLVMIETEILLDPNFNLKRELKEAKKIYSDKLKVIFKDKQITKDEERVYRFFDKKLAYAYYKKRILQNYEEYSNYGKITEPILDSPFEIKEGEIVNPNVIKKGKYVRPQQLTNIEIKDPETLKKEKAQKLKEFKEFQAIQLQKMLEFENKQVDNNLSKTKTVKARKTSPNAKTKRK